MNNAQLSKLFNPDVTVLLDRVKVTDKDINVHLLYALCNAVKSSISIEEFNPSIYIEDFNNQIAFNNQLNIEAPESIKASFITTFRVDFIYDDNLNNHVYCFFKTQPYNTNNDCPVEIVNFNKSLLELTPNDCLRYVNSKLKELYPSLWDDTLNISINITLHHYQAAKNKWKIIIPISD